MARVPNRFGRGVQTNRNGLAFEQTTLLDSALSAVGYLVIDCGAFYEKKIY